MKIININVLGFRLVFIRTLFVFLRRLFNWGWWRAFVYVEVSWRARNLGCLASLLVLGYSDAEVVVLS